MAVAKITEISSSSSKSFEDAINAGIARAEKTLRNLTGAWIKSQKVVITKGRSRSTACCLRSLSC
jgi:flavin-binding protein dodecin